MERAKDHFKSKPFSLKYDQAKSLSHAVHELLEQARKRQRANPGTTYSGTVLQHLVGAKLETILPDGQITHHGASVADASTARSGDFIIGETVIHVTTAPAEALMRKCLNNIDSGFRPIIITTHESKAGAESLLNIHGIGDRVDLLDAEQFLATNVYEWSLFKISDCRPTVERLLTRYNAIVEQCEADPSLKVCLG